MNSGHHGHAHPAGPDAALRARAIESLLLERGILAPGAVEALIETFTRDVGPLNGARAVARAWADPGYKQRLLADGNAALSELGLRLDQEFIVLENTDRVHNVIVCTLCSCYPWTVLGLPPSWYTSPQYRSRMVIEPRAVLAEFGLQLDDTIEVRVWDSNAETRYMVLPQRPLSTGGWSEEDLAGLVTREAMTGVAIVEPSPPAEGQALS